VNEALRVTADGFVSTSDLAARPDFVIGQAIVSPSTRMLTGPGGTTDVEPRVMQVLVVLAEAEGQVVTRETLFRRCWGSPNVGEDSLNRAVSAIRKLAAGAGGSSFAIENISRTGYRLSGGLPAQGVSEEDPRRGLARREVAGGALGLVALGGLGAWAAVNSTEDRRFERLLRGATDALWDDNQFDPRRSLRMADAAVRMKPNDPRGLGLLALTQSYFAQIAAPKDSVAAVAIAGATAQRALALNPGEPNALFAMFQLEGSILGYWDREQRLRQILAADPESQGAIHELAQLLQTAGYSRESWMWGERGVSLQPLSQYFLAGRALKLWIFGRIGEADKIVDQLRSLFPKSCWVWWVRFAIYALTDRPIAARAMLDGDRSMLAPADAAMWRPALQAIAQETPENVRTAREACAAAARVSGDLAGQGAMIMSLLGDVGAAFEIANGFLLSRGPIVRNPAGTQGDKSDAPARINTQWLFSPACAAMRADHRFVPLCDGIGLTDYWRRRGVKPDYQLQK
jgi:DNA-binding winged helix-turn-helix (wHTH) protein